MYSTFQVGCYRGAQLEEMLLVKIHFHAVHILVNPLNISNNIAKLAVYTVKRSASFPPSGAEINQQSTKCALAPLSKVKIPSKLNRYSHRKVTEFCSMLNIAP